MVATLTRSLEPPRWKRKRLSSFPDLESRTEARDDGHKSLHFSVECMLGSPVFFLC